VKIVKEIGHGHLIPPWYGVAWRKYDTDTATCLPIPINFIAAIVRSCFYFIKNGHLSISMSPRDAYNQGFHDGLEFGKRDANN
jgi:hypothetical protein